MASLDELIDGIAPFATGAPRAAMRKAYRDAAREFFTETRQWREEVGSATTTAGSPTVDLTIDADTDIFDVDFLYVDDTSLAKGSARRAQQLFGRDPSGSPEMFWVERSNTVRLAPPPQVDGATLWVEAIVRPSRSAQAIDDGVVDRFGASLEHGAIAFLLRQPKQPWTDLEASGVFYGLFQERIDDLRNRGARGDASNVPRRMRYGGL